MWVPGENSFYYVSGRSGAFNVWKRDLGTGEDVRLTNFEGDGVILPTLSADGGTMVFRVTGDLYRFDPRKGEPPVKVEFFTKEKLPNRSVRKEKVTGTSSVALAPDGKRILFSAAGDLWTVSHEGKEERCTETDDADERDPVFSEDGSHVFFLKDDGRTAGIWQAKWSGKEISELVEIHASVKSKKSLRLSPDGSRLSWIEATGDLMTLSVAGGEPVRAMAGWDTPTYDWSPDGKWLVVAAKDKQSNRDIFVVAADGEGEPINFTRHPAFEGSPKWSPDGSKIVFVARRGEDGIAKFWMADVRGGFDSAEVRELETDVGEPIRVAWASDSEGVLFQSRDTKDEAIYEVDIDSGDVEEVADFRGIPVSVAKGLWRIDRVPTLIGKDGRKAFGFSFSVRQDREKRLRLGFRRIWRTLAERFYDPGMNATDWEAVLEKYEDAAAVARDSRQFDRVVAQLLGELNASHLTFRARPWGLGKETEGEKKATAFPGLEFANNGSGPLVIDSVLEGSPVSKVQSPPVAGEIVRRIAGRDVDASSPLWEIFNGAEGRPLPLVLEDADGTRRTLELIPISYEEARLLDREEKRRTAVEKTEEKGFTYLPFRRMKSEDLRDLGVEVYRASLGSKGMVLDLRDNAGGRVADELLAMFCQPVHTFTVPRGGPRGYPADRRAAPAWDGPMVVLCNGNTFSNAEIFCHAFKQLDRGPLVGMPTNGGVISAVSVKIPEVGDLQIPFRGWYDVETGKDLELNGAVPDVLVDLGPADQVMDRDPQLDEAIRLLEKEEISPEIPGLFKHGGKVVPE